MVQIETYDIDDHRRLGALFCMGPKQREHFYPLCIIEHRTSTSFIRGLMRVIRTSFITIAFVFLDSLATITDRCP